MKKERVKKLDNSRNEIWEWAKSLLIGILLMVLIRTFILTPIVVDGASMNTTLMDHDRMIVNKLDKPERFDIVVFHASETEDYIKRVIGLPGDRIEYKDDTLYINGAAYEEPYLDEQKNNTPGLLTKNFTLEDTPVAAATVPEGEIFVMGDNRAYSKDSRMIGAIPLDQVIGTTNIVFWPVGEMKLIRH